MNVENKPIAMLAAGGGAAILASSCCFGPLLMVSVGLGGVWVSSLQVLGHFKPMFLGVALLAMIIACRKIFRPAADCKPGMVCALPQSRIVYKVIFWKVLALMLFTFAFPYFAHYFY